MYLLRNMIWSVFNSSYLVAANICLTYKNSQVNITLILILL